MRSEGISSDPGQQQEFRTSRSLRQASSGAAAKAGCPAPAEGSRGPRFHQRFHRSPQATSHETLILELRSLTALPGCKQAVSPGLDVNGQPGSSAEGLCSPDASLASLELGSQFQASQLGGCGQHGSRDRLAGQPPVAGLCFIPLGSWRGRSLGEG